MVGMKIKERKKANPTAIATIVTTAARSSPRFQKTSVMSIASILSVGTAVLPASSWHLHPTAESLPPQSEHKDIMPCNVGLQRPARGADFFVQPEIVQLIRE